MLLSALESASSPLYSPPDTFQYGTRFRTTFSHRRLDFTNWNCTNDNADGTVATGIINVTTDPFTAYRIDSKRTPLNTGVGQIVVFRDDGYPWGGISFYSR
jgi:hypothetical protein